MDWLVRDEKIDFGEILNEILSDKNIIFFGRISYHKWRNFQPDENASKKTKDAYKLIDSKQKFVFSNTKKEDNTNAIFINSNIKESILKIKEQSSKNIWLCGGAKLASTFLNLDLIDKYVFWIVTVFLGIGKTIFKNEEAKLKLELLSSKKFDNGNTMLQYKI